MLVKRLELAPDAHSLAWPYPGCPAHVLDTAPNAAVPARPSLLGNPPPPVPSQPLPAAPLSGPLPLRSHFCLHLGPKEPSSGPPHPHTNGGRHAQKKPIPAAPALGVWGPSVCRRRSQHPAPPPPPGALGRERVSDFQAVNGSWRRFPRPRAWLGRRSGWPTAAAAATDIGLPSPRARQPLRSRGQESNAEARAPPAPARAPAGLGGPSGGSTAGPGVTVCSVTFFRGPTSPPANGSGPVVRTTSAGSATPACLP